MCTVAAHCEEDMFSRRNMAASSVKIRVWELFGRAGRGGCFRRAFVTECSRLYSSRADSTATTVKDADPAPQCRRDESPLQLSDHLVCQGCDRQP